MDFSEFERKETGLHDEHCREFRDRKFTEKAMKHSGLSALDAALAGKPDHLGLSGASPGMEAWESALASARRHEEMMKPSGLSAAQIAGPGHLGLSGMSPNRAAWESALAYAKSPNEDLMGAYLRDLTNPAMALARVEAKRPGAVDIAGCLPALDRVVSRLARSETVPADQVAAENQADAAELVEHIQPDALPVLDKELEARGAILEHLRKARAGIASDPAVQSAPNTAAEILGFLDSIELFGRFGDALQHAISAARSLQSRDAVGARGDQRQREEFLELGRKAVAAGETYRTVSELQGACWFKPEWSGRNEGTLKKWAKEAGFTFRSGRPSKEKTTTKRA